VRDRYGEGAMAGKRAMLVVTTGGWETHYGPRGINGPIDDLLFPIQHGILHYPGFEVVPPVEVHRTSRVDEARHAAITAALATRLDGLWTDPPIAFRRQNAGGLFDPRTGALAGPRWVRRPHRYLIRRLPLEAFWISKHPLTDAARIA
jgi:hypothetical protein